MSTTGNLLAPRKPWLAIVLSLLAPGLGQVYTGRLIRGLVLLAFTCCTAPLILICSITDTFRILMAIGLIVFAIALEVYALIDAYLAARRFRSAYVLRKFNRWNVYVGFLIAHALLPVLLSIPFFPASPAFIMVGNSMAPAIQEGDRVLVDFWKYEVETPATGDVVLVTTPNQTVRNSLRRIAAVAGETIEVRGGVVYLNDKPREGTPNPSVGDYPRTMVPESCVFVLPDDLSVLGRDSRTYGPLPTKEVRGKVTFLYWPATPGWDRFGPFASRSGSNRAPEKDVSPKE